MENANQIPKWHPNPKQNYALGSLAIILVATIGFSYINSPIRFAPSIKDVADSGFGPLAIQTGAEKSRSQSGGGFGGGLGGGGGVAMNMAVSSDAKMIAPYPPYEITKIVYQYSGEDFTQDNPTISIYKRIVDESTSRTLGKNASKMGLGLADLSKLNSPFFTDVNISEQIEYGYNVSLNLREGWMSFYQNWEKWPQPASCSDELSCQKINLIEESKIPDEQSIVSIADTFIKKYGINLSSYGRGMINKNWLNSFVHFPRSVDTGTQLVGPDIPVLYPLLINDNEVYEEWGGQLGIMMTVNAITKKVTSASNIGVQNYQRSGYAAETDVKKIIELAEKGGTGETYYYETPTKIITVKLGTPRIELAQIYKYSDKPGPGEILYVPSMIFPVIDISDRLYFQRESVVIPLASELFNQRLNPIQPPGNIMPLRDSSLSEPPVKELGQ